MTLWIWIYAIGAVITLVGYEANSFGLTAAARWQIFWRGLFWGLIWPLALAGLIIFGICFGLFVGGCAVTDWAERWI